MNWITCPHCKISFDLDHPDNHGEYEETDEGHATSIICPECDECIPTEVSP